VRLLKYWWVTFLLALTTAVLYPCISEDFNHRPIFKVYMTLRTFETVLERRHAGTGSYPSEAGGLKELVPMELRRLPMDPWGNAYAYAFELHRSKPLVYSIGVNGIDERGGGDDVVGPSKNYSCEVYGVDCGFNPLASVAHFVVFMGLLSLIVGIARGVRFVLGYANPE
jgi:hypothetical protein